MTEQEAAQADDEADTTAQPEANADESGLAGAVDDRASQLTGSQGAAQTDSPVTDNSGPVAQAEEHLEDVNLDAERETLKKLQSDM